MNFEQNNDILLTNNEELIEEVNQPIKPSWYVIVVNSGQEFSVRDKLLGIMKNKQFEGLIYDARVISTTHVNNNGKEVEKVDDYKGYVFVKMIHNDDTYNAVKLQIVRHILGGPSPISKEEAERLFGEDA